MPEPYPPWPSCCPLWVVFNLLLLLLLKMNSHRGVDGVLILIKRILIRIPFQWDSPGHALMMTMLTTERLLIVFICAVEAEGAS